MSPKKKFSVNLLDKDSVTEAVKVFSYSLMSVLECRFALLERMSNEQAEEIMDQQNRLVDDMLYGIWELRLAHCYTMDNRKVDAKRQVKALKATMNKLANEISLLKDGQKKRWAHARRILESLDASRA